jgi:hypothetical protein
MRKKAWRCLIISALNEALRRGLFSLDRKDDLTWDGVTFQFLIDGIPAAAFMNDIGYGEIGVNVALYPPSDLEALKSNNAGLQAGEAFASAWFERDRGSWIQDRIVHFKCRKHLLPRLANLNPTTLGYKDRGPVM